MSLIINRETKVIVQGATGRQGSYHVKAMQKYGTNVVAGITPGKGGSEASVPIYDTVLAAKERHGVDASMIMTPPPFVLSAAMEAIDAGVPLIVIITEHVAVHDTMRIKAYATQCGAVLVGPNTIGVINCRQKVKIGVMPDFLYGAGDIGVISRSGTLSHETASNLQHLGKGLSTVIGIGGDQIIGADFVAALRELKDDKDTKSVVLLGEIGGDREEEAARYLCETEFGKPVVAFIAGRNAPPGKKMGHAGAIIQGSAGAAAGKEELLRQAGVKVAISLEELLNLV
jgi:succinyl-CoA synthetase alpha subunit